MILARLLTNSTEPIFFALLKQFGLHSSTLGLIRTMYHHTDAFIDINGSLSPIIHMKNGLRQGCPLSALLFILGIEPFLFHLQHNSSIQSSSPFKNIAYADDIICCLKINSLRNLFDTINDFSSVTNRHLNLQKTEILCYGSLPTGFQSVATIKIFGRGVLKQISYPNDFCNLAGAKITIFL